MSAWFQTTGSYSAAGAAGDIVNWGTNTNTERSGVLLTQGGNTEYFVGQGDDLNGTKVVNDGRWHNIVATYASGVVTMYVDGVQDVSQTLGSALNTVGTTITIGNAIPGHSAEQLVGAIDDVRVYNRVLSVT